MNVRYLIATAFAAVAPGAALFAQNAPAASAAAKEEAIQLPAFTISSEKDDSFVGKTALSTTRIAVDLAELPQSVTVLNKSFFDQLKVGMISDMLMYVGGGQNGNINWTPGRMNLRGFTGDSDYADGFVRPSNTAMDDVVFERLEVVKGPSAIFLAADGSPGGIMNKITKSPSSVASTEIGVQVGLFDANKVTLDSTGALTKDKKLTYRVVAGYTYSKGYYKATYMHRLTDLVALSYDFSPDTKLTLKGQFGHADWPSYNGLSVDPRTRKMMDLPYDSTSDFDRDYNWRTDNPHNWALDFHSRLNNYMAVSVRGMRAFNRSERLEAISSTWAEGTQNGTATIGGVARTVTFLGGKWTTPATVGTSESVAPVNFYVQNGTTFVTDSWAGTPTYTGGAIPRSTINADDGHSAYNDVQADVNFNYSGKGYTALLLVGAEHRNSPGYTITWKNGTPAAPAASAWFPYGGEGPIVMTTNYSAPSAYQQTQSLQNRGYALGTLKLFGDRFIPSFGVSRASTMSGTYNALTRAYTRYNLNANLVQWGAVFKVMKNVSLFTGFNQNFALNGTGTVGGVPGSVLAPKSGQQHEAGIKSTWLDGRFTFNMSYFDIQQQNNTVPSFPFDPLNPNVLVPGVISRGFDGDWTFKASSSLYMMGSFANYAAKSVLGATFDGNQGSKFQQPGTGSIAYGSVPVNNTAQQTASLYVVYKYDRQWTFGLGPNYQSKRAVTDGPNQVFWGYLPSRLVVNASVTYQYEKHLRYSLTVDNLLNKKYIYSSRSEDVIVPGTPINLKLGMYYTF
jgi:iron complex outermembrane receptor protein